MAKRKKNQKELPGLTIKQSRSQKTYDALIKKGFKLLKKMEYDDITVAELSRVAGYSVGAFYTRFRSKDEYFDALVAHHLINRSEIIDHLFSKYSGVEVVDELVKDLVRYYWINLRFWRAALVRSMRDQEFWEPIRKSGHATADRVIDKISNLAGRPLTDLEQTNIRFAFQVVFGTINNTIINQPGPIYMDQELFEEQLTKAFRLVSDIENIINF